VLRIVPLSMIFAMVAQPSFGQRASVMRAPLKNNSGTANGRRKLLPIFGGCGKPSGPRSALTTAACAAGSSRLNVSASRTGRNASAGTARAPVRKTAAPGAARYTTGAPSAPESSAPNASLPSIT
jgi:hypothetical protein